MLHLALCTCFRLVLCSNSIKYVEDDPNHSYNIDNLKPHDRFTSSTAINILREDLLYRRIPLCGIDFRNVNNSQVEV